MNTQSILNNKLPFTILVAILIGIHVLWDYYNGGVPTHHLLASDDLPGISNWWGIITVPLLTWISISLVQRKIQNSKVRESKADKGIDHIGISFIAALVFGIILSVFWEFGITGISDYLILLPFILSLFMPVHLPQYLLGFVLGMSYTFGGILPIIFGIVILTISFIINKISSFIVSLIKKT